MGKRCEEIDLGDVAKDDVSGFRGVVIAITRWLHGCDRICIQPQELKDAKPIDGVTFDRLQMSLIKKTVVEATARSEVNNLKPAGSGGPQNDKAALRRN